MVLEAIRYKPHSLQILNQLKLPHQIEYDDVTGSEDGWNAIKDMRTRGGPAIAIVAALSLAVELHVVKSLWRSSEQGMRAMQPSSVQAREDEKEQQQLDKVARAQEKEREKAVKAQKLAERRLERQKKAEQKKEALTARFAAKAAAKAAKEAAKQLGQDIQASPKRREGRTEHLKRAHEPHDDRMSLWSNQDRGCQNQLYHQWAELSSRIEQKAKLVVLNFKCFNDGHLEIERRELQFDCQDSGVK
ncbi:S-methyl-5-thioribose-1-phosphate isomerase [Friedmanniomyces endolithicus]|uniref:S-methyl-5-thioribose-1-phosphate isomerase n=1 Tax=Friedmanniomyces endolithicus TaxID=329885 RepID=A0AAN6J8Q4_9PEZI|nr:S-methyl-5-thioribose-1-phosphate isomerase [Friedmanniomyces endolithicus]